MEGRKRFGTSRGGILFIVLIFGPERSSDNSAGVINDVRGTQSRLTRTSDVLESCHGPCLLDESFVDNLFTQFPYKEGEDILEDPHPFHP